MATTKTIAQIVEQIRTAIFGRDVRENLADGIEKCYDDVMNGVTTADAAAAKIDDMTVAASNLAPGSTATATISEVSGHKHVAFGIPKGDKGDKGDTGDPFYIAKTYSTVSAMNSDLSGSDTHVGDYVMIIGDNSDKGKIYRKGSSSWTYVTNLIGPKGDKGDKGNTGDTGPVPIISTQVTGTVPYDRASEASVTVDNTDINHPIFKFVLPQGPTGSVGTITGSDIPVSSSDNTRINAAFASVNSVLNSKATKPSSAAAGNFASLDGTGNLIDSGHKHGDYLTKIFGATAGNFVSVNSIGNVVDSGKKASDFVDPSQLDEKVDKDDLISISFDGDVSPSDYEEGTFITWNGVPCVAVEDISEESTVDPSVLPSVSSFGGVANILSNRIVALDSAPLIKIIQYSATYNIDSTGYTHLYTSDFKENIAGVEKKNWPVMSLPEGYTPIAVASYDTGLAPALPYCIDVTSIGTSEKIFSLRNVKSTAYSDKELIIKIVFIRTENIVSD